MKKLVFLLAVVFLSGLYMYSNREIPVTEVYTGEKEPAEPTVSVNSVGRPRFAKEDTEMFAGTGFLLEHRLSPVMVGAYHTLRSADGLEAKGIEPSLRSKLSTLAVPKLEPLEVPSQGNSSYEFPANESNARGDVAAFFVKDLHQEAESLKLAVTDAKIGEPVWVVEMRGSAKAPTGIELVPGHVQYHSNKVLVIKMEKQTQVKGTSGAPVVNAAGEVVGVNVGFSQGPDGEYVRLAAPGLTLREMIRLN
jgi:trypsin-like peptidase